MQKIMASINEGLRRFLYAAPRGSNWNLVLLDGGNVTVSADSGFDSRNTTWQARWEYLRELDRSVKYTCTSPDMNSFVKAIPEVAQNEATTVIALLHSDSAPAGVVKALATIHTVRLVLILFHTAATPQHSTWRLSVLRADNLFMVPAASSQESMAALVDLALHSAHHATADLDGDVIKARTWPVHMLPCFSPEHGSSNLERYGSFLYALAFMPRLGTCTKAGDDDLSFIIVGPVAISRAESIDSRHPYVSVLLEA
ncbi:hypothetical protein HPB51_029533 [Rhipicephalus microplus]|uniref:Uncharacterized protein n=1 Tax=Rhipicephalus microplus TaxID=6941 RepID=A0A9J6CTX5_RHIMP|nr:hypothetical protein HPB51_029533 [Rhipicephalus microplus]